MPDHDTETLAEVLVRELTAEYGDEPEWTELGSIRRITRAIEAHFAARIVQARAGEGALREACERAWDEGATAAWYDCQIGSDDSRDACEMRVDNPYALTTADPS